MEAERQDKTLHCSALLALAVCCSSHRTHQRARHCRCATIAGHLQNWAAPGRDSLRQMKHAASSPPPDEPDEPTVLHIVNGVLVKDLIIMFWLVVSDNENWGSRSHQV